MQSGTYPTRNLRYLRTVRITAARLLEFSIHIYFLQINTPLNFLAPGRHPDPLISIKRIRVCVFIKQYAPSNSVPLHLHIMFPKLPSNFARVPSTYIFSSAVVSSTSLLCRFEIPIIDNQKCYHTIMQ